MRPKQKRIVIWTIGFEVDTGRLPAMRGLRLVASHFFRVEGVSFPKRPRDARQNQPG